MQLRTEALLACAAATMMTLSCGARHHEIRTATGELAYRINCPRDSKQCYERAAQLCPRGYRTLQDDEKVTGIHLDRDTKGDLQRVNTQTETELTVACGTKSVAASAEPALTPASGAAPSAPAPTGAAGFAFGASPSEAQAVCEAAGHKWQTHPTTPSCSGIPGNTGYRGTSRVGICHTGKLCWVSLQIAEANSSSRDQLAKTIGQKYKVQQHMDAQGTLWWRWANSRYVSLEAVRTESSEMTLWYADEDGSRILSAQGL